LDLGVREAHGRRGPEGDQLAGHDERNKHVDGVAAPGRFFGAE